MIIAKGEVVVMGGALVLTMIVYRKRMETSGAGFPAFLWLAVSNFCRYDLRDVEEK